jgi:hypothetical protein
MDTVTLYRQLIKKTLTEYIANRPTRPDIEVSFINDPVSDHYQLMVIGWMDQERVYGSIIHITLHNGKIWIQHDGTEDGMAERLLAAGVPKTDIVLGFHSPFKRQFTEFAVG